MTSLVPLFGAAVAHVAIPAPDSRVCVGLA
jgi:hypothetical protein